MIPVFDSDRHVFFPNFYSQKNFKATKESKEHREHPILYPDLSAIKISPCLLSPIHILPNHLKVAVGIMTRPCV